MTRGKKKNNACDARICESILDLNAFLEVLNRKILAQLTVLQCSSIKSYEMARILVDAGADIHMKATPMQWTVLHTAIQVMRGLVPDLLAHKADPNVTETATNHSNFQ